MERPELVNDAITSLLARALARGKKAPGQSA
jgi:hypothetical protein